MRHGIIVVLMATGLALVWSSCSPKRGGGMPGYVWSDDVFRSADQTCVALSARETAVSPKARCECAVLESRKRWSAEDFQTDPEGRLKEVLKMDGIYSCMGWRLESFEQVDVSCAAEVRREFASADVATANNACACISRNAATKWRYDDFSARYADYYEFLKNEGVVSGCRAEAGLGKTWQNATLLEMSDSGNAGFPRVAMTSDGDALALWTQFDGVRPNQTTSRFRFSGGWSLPVSLEEGNTAISGYADLATDRQGGAMAVWSRIGAGGNIWAARYEKGAWESAILIEDANVVCPANDCGGGDWRAVRVAMETSGHAAAVWPVGTTLWVNRFDPITKAWLGAEKLADNARSPDVAFDEKGRAMFVWVDTAVKIRVWDFKSGWAEPVTIASEGFPSEPRIVTHENGTGLVAWLAGTTRRSVMTSFYAVDQGWGPGRVLDEGKGDCSEVAVSMDSQGLAFVAWQEKREAREIMVTRTRDGTTWEAVFPLIPNSAGFSFAPQLASDGSGQTLLVFNRYDGKNWNIFHTAYDGMGWRLVRALPGFAGKDRLEPAVAADQTGQAVVVFYQEDGTVRNFYGSVLR